VIEIVLVRMIAPERQGDLGRRGRGDSVGNSTNVNERQELGYTNARTYFIVGASWLVWGRQNPAVTTNLKPGNDSASTPSNGSLQKLYVVGPNTCHHL
jgi:hypothetical protein